MNVYIYCLALTLFFSCIADLFNKNNNYMNVLLRNIFLFISAIPPFVVGAFRYYIGTDYGVYSSFQIPLVISGFDKNYVAVEPGYQYVIKVGYWLNYNFYRFFSNQYQWVFILTQFLIIFFIYLAIKKNGNNYSLAWFIFYSLLFFFNSLNLMRQSIGMAIIILAIVKFIKNNKLKEYYLLLLLACLFHKIILIFIFVPFLKKININRFIVLVVPPVSYFFMASLRNITFFLSSILGYGDYFGSSRDTNDQGWSIVIINYFILIILYLIGKNQDNANEKIYLYMQTICSTLAFVSPILPNSYRIVILFSSTIIVALPYYFKNYNVKLRYKMMLLLILIISFYYNFYYIHSEEFFPYISIFELM